MRLIITTGFEDNAGGLTIGYCFRYTLFMQPFHFSRVPELYFGPGSRKQLEKIFTTIAPQNVALISGAKSLRESLHWPALISSLEESHFRYQLFSAAGEPSPELVDSIVREAKTAACDCVLSVGGGSVLDTGKAVSALLKSTGSVADYLEGLGERIPSGAKVPFIALPTTSGTGAEATKNAVISRTGPGGFKKSLRHDNYIPDYALIDPELILTCPPDVTLYSGLDAITQLLEAYVSNQANPLTDSLAESGLQLAANSFVRAVEFGDKDLDARTGMAYAAYLSGVALANAGLGIVHGLASALGGAFDIPHGLICSILVTNSTRLVIDKLREESGEESVAIRKYARAGALLSRRDGGTISKNCALLVDTLTKWARGFRIPGLKRFGVAEQDLDKIVSLAGQKNSPLKLRAADLKKLVAGCLESA